jgi:hypothetical protein
MTSMQEVAGEARGWFTTRERRPLLVNGDAETFVSLGDNAPQWVRDLVQSAHGEFLPDDHRYAMIRSALDAVAESEASPDWTLDEIGHEFADNAHIYNSDLLKWLASHLDRVGYCDEACDEYGLPAETDMIARISAGQTTERREVFSLVVDALQRRLDEVSTDA